MEIARSWPFRWRGKMNSSISKQLPISAADRAAGLRLESVSLRLQAVVGRPNVWRFVVLIVAVMAIASLCACGGGSTASPPPPPPPPPVCSVAGATSASAQTRVRLGAYYFDGWSGPLTNFHFDGLVNGPYQDREPLSGWQDNTACAVEQQLAWAHSFGIDFFVFDRPGNYKSRHSLMTPGTSSEA